MREDRPISGLRGAPRALVTALCAFAAACAYAPGPSSARPVLAAPLPLADLAPVTCPSLLELEETAPGRIRGKLQQGAETVSFQYWRGSVTEHRPLVLLVPILAGGDELMAMVGQRMMGFGFDVAFCGRAGSALRPPQRGPELADLFRRTVLHQRLLLAWLREHDAPPDVFVLGMSMGGMIATATTALEPSVAGLAICMSGADLAGLLRTSSEQRVRRWVDWREQQDGVGQDHLEWELRENLDYEPLALAGAVPTAKALLIGAEFDSVVPLRNQNLLWEALGRPARLQVPFGHYTAALAIDEILAAAAAHFAARKTLPAPH